MPSMIGAAAVGGVMLKDNSSLCPVSVLVPVKNEERNLGRCLERLRGWAGEVVVVDSQSTDGTVEIAQSYGATVLQFHYQGGWPKKRQWALDTYPFRHEWLLLLDADEILDGPIKSEIVATLRNPKFDGYWLRFRIFFLGRMLRFGDSQFWKLSLFRKGRAHYEKRLERQDASMLDIEVHEHVVVDGPAGWLRCPVRHESLNSLARYIEKQNAHSNWGAKVVLEGSSDELPPAFFGNQAQHRRWLKRYFLRLPGSPLLFFLYKYIFRLGFADGKPGLIHAALQSIEQFQIKAKIYEARLQRRDANRL